MTTPKNPPKPPTPPDTPKPPTPKPSPQEKWDAIITKTLEDRETITEIEGQNPNRFREQNFFELYEFSPDRSNPSEKYLLSGNEESISTQASLLVAIHKMLGGRSQIDFARWKEHFENGFPQWQGKSKRLQDTGSPWGKAKDARPKVVELTTTDELDYKTVEFFPNRANLSESYLFAGTYQQIIAQIMHFWALWPNLADLAVVLGYPIDQYLRQEQKSGTQLHLRLATEKEPPFTRTRFGANGFEYDIKPRQVVIPNPRQIELDYHNLKQICGGSAGLDWGNYSARAYIAFNDSIKNMKGLTQIVAGGSSPEKANQNLDRFLTLTEGHEVSRSCTELKLDKGTAKQNPRSPYMRKYEVYPAYCWVENEELLRMDDALNKGRPTLSGKMISRENKFYLWEDEPPLGWEESLKELLKSPRRAY